MGDLIEEHRQMKKLVKTGVLIPGVYSGKVGSMTYTPISIEEYLNKVKFGNIFGLAYNTRTMGRGIFTLGNEGEIINFKGVDSHLQNENSIAISKTEGDDISSSLNATNPTRDDNYKRLEYRNQVYIWITNMIIIENAYKLIGREIPQGYKESF